jgi:hypothetical protein
VGTDRVLPFPVQEQRNLHAVQAHNQDIGYLLARGEHGLKHGPIRNGQENPTVGTSEMFMQNGRVNFGDLHVLFTMEPTLPIFKMIRRMASRDGISARHVLGSGA